MELPNLRSLRLRRLLTQDELASATGLTKASISRLENGVTKARISTVRRLLHALDVDLDDLIHSATAQPKASESRKENAPR